MRRALVVLAAVLLAGCYTTATRVIGEERAEAWPALPGTYDVTITRPGQAPERKRWVFEAAEGATPVYRFVGAGPEPAETVVQTLAGPVRLVQIADGRGKYLLMLARPTANGFEVLLHEGVPERARAHDVEAVPLDTGYQLNGTAESIRALLTELAGRPAPALAQAVRRAGS